MATVPNETIRTLKQQPPPCLVRLIVAHGGEVMYIGSFCFRGELGFLDCYDICMCVVNKHFELLEFVLNSVYVDPMGVLFRYECRL